MSKHIHHSRRKFLCGSRRALICWLGGLAFAIFPSFAQTFRVLYTLPSSFVGESSGQLTEVSPGLFYGASQAGIFAVNSKGGKLIRAFSANDGYPVGQLVEGVSGLLYGAASNGGGNGYGYLFASDFNGDLSVLDSFATGTQYAFPITTGYDFNFYGVLGNNPNVFYKAPISGGFVVLHTFDPATEGVPAGPLVQNTDGSFYGVAFTPYSMTSPAMVYKVTKTGLVTPLYAFPSSVQWVGNTLLRASNGLFYGVTWGTGCSGTIFQMTPAGAVTTLVSSGICQPAVLIEGSDGNFYGADLMDPLPGGGSDPYGAIFRMTPFGALTTVYTFANNLSQGSAPASLVQGSDGKLYGVTSSGIGSVFSLDLGLPKPPPVVFYFYPATAAAGSGIIVSGYNLLSPSSVSFNGVPATRFGARGSNYVVVVVPSGATSGPITVTTPGGTFTTRATFTVK